MIWRADWSKVIEKHHPGSFKDTDLHEYLQKEGIKKVILTGYMVQLPEDP